MAFLALGGINSHLKGVTPSQKAFSLQNGSCTSAVIYSRSNRVNLKCIWGALTGSSQSRMLGATTLNRISCKSESIPKDQSGVLEKDDTQGRKKLAVFVSGAGSNFRALHQAALNDLIYGDITVLVTDKPSCRASDYARENNIPVIIFPKSMTEPSGLSSADLVTTLRNFEINFLLLAGYLKLIPEELVQAFSRSILNIHPSLLPAFGGKGYYGMKVHKAVIASGARFSGPTIHFVDEKYDTGKILAQRVVPVLANDTSEDLAARVLKEEHSLYVEVVAAICEGRLCWRKDGVPLIRKSWDEEEYY
ncbi:hypothetical protein SUGI_1021950 [Cryptomeria japonica]|uniref:phosphoribosylglycinamide formyltransferase, chloroplastic isoform X2 n=1 Tax=Cryptomeria japonica TaxID=3369 RepID=UPI0024148356|nr:phosphoribosylglycinamide formyltransferase, chloroplastic isoform X2 [Cryptomeria japonica]GLJ48417.1 hypothetical protein SUGI_1021950 [Cryptomeria japonica]